MQIRKIINIIMSFVYPLYCISCNVEGSYFCTECQTKKIKISISSCCPVCKRASTHGKVHDKCRQNFFLNGLIVMAKYNENVEIKKLIKNLKYRYSSDASKILGKALKNFLNNQNFPIESFDIVPIPLHWRRYLQRGFNQSERIASELGQTHSLVKRIKYTKEQTKLQRKERLSNLKNAFKCNKKITSKNILLIDDIATTCTTLNECAKTLKMSGAKQVWGCVIARNQ